MKVIIAPNIHFLNFVLFYILSLVYKVRTYEIHPFLQKFGRIEVLNLLHYLDWDECVITDEEAVRISEGLIKGMPDSMWKVCIRGRTTDLSLRIKKDIFREIERYAYLKKILSREKS